MASAPRILVKGRLAPGHGTLALGAGHVTFTAERLFQSVGAAHGPGIAEQPAWHLVTAQESDTNAWDLCHAAVASAPFALAPGSIEIAEPDLGQSWQYDGDAGRMLALVAGCAQSPPKPDFPSEPDPLWYRDAAHANFTAAGAAGEGAVIAHLDTGFDPEHHTVPRNVQTELQRNFVDPKFPNDASERAAGDWLTNFGHGTGTLGILAGNATQTLPEIGGAPGASVIPVRVANGVVLFYNADVARGFDYVHALNAAGKRVDIVSLSMGGLASFAWADAVNALYDQGVFIVAAAGNNHRNLPTRNIVFPARFRRVVAACGVMADGRPYADLDGGRMAGNYGPPSKMTTAMAAYTPNLPWPRFGCPDVVNLDGAGTSSPTPQIAAAAALWIAAHRAALDAYPEPWMRVEAVRAALFGSAAAGDETHLGRGTLRAADALAFEPPPASALVRQDPDKAWFPLLRILTGLGVAPVPAQRQAMLELEALQLSQSAAVESLLSDPDDPPESPAQRREILDALASHPSASAALRDALGRSEARPHVTVPALGAATPVSAAKLAAAVAPAVPVPAVRRLRVYSSDPTLGVQLDTLGLNETRIEIRWEKLEPGPVGEYLEVVDVDPISGCAYAPVDLDHPHLLVADGLRPSETNPQFHQQMAYAVAMKTIEHFERALGRVALWSPRYVHQGSKITGTEFVRRLRIHPHALHQANAFYSPQIRALLFGYFSASAGPANETLPGTFVHGSLSYDIIAHETTHALLDGLHRRFNEPTNPDVRAFHEAFADIVALFQHFTLPETLRDQIARSRGDLARETPLSQLAVQFGRANGSYGALRDAIGHFDDAGTWVPTPVSRADYGKETEVHARGALLVSAVFDAFLRIYKLRAADLVRLATGGTGILPQGALPDVLIDALAREAAKLASQWLTICIRALDYCPPVDITFGDYLRALITADRDVVPDDKRSYRVAFLSAFRDRGIFPEGVRNLSLDSVAWEPPPTEMPDVGKIIDQVSQAWNLTVDRSVAHEKSEQNGKMLWDRLLDPAKVSDDQFAALGFERNKKPIAFTVGDVPGVMAPIEVHSVRPARRIAPNGEAVMDLVVEITQTFRPNDDALPWLRGGVTMLIGLEAANVRYLIGKRASESRYAAQRRFRDEAGALAARSNYFDDWGGWEPFALLHNDY
jgi:Subtilase family